MQTTPPHMTHKLAAASESNHLAVAYSQYTQMWMLIEQTISSNLSGNINHSARFNLPKDALVTMFQEINRHSMTTNQTYLIDMNTPSNSAQQSQLRRKHHCMVMLMGLKFKFQLFVVNLLKYEIYSFLNKASIM